MTNARCLWYWDGAASLMQLAMEGVTAPQNCKFTMPADEVTILDGCDIYLASLAGDMRKSYPIFEYEVIGNIHDNPELLNKVRLCER